MTLTDPLNFPTVLKIVRNANNLISKITGGEVTIIVKLLPGAKAAPKEKLKAIISKTFNLSWDEIIRPNKKTVALDARAVYMYFGKYYLHQTVKETGKDLGNRHYSNVVKGLKKVKGFFDVNDPFVETINKIKEQL